MPLSKKTFEVVAHKKLLGRLHDSATAKDNAKKAGDKKGKYEANATYGSGFNSK
jgi:hypothetical protein